MTEYNELTQNMELQTNKQAEVAQSIQTRQLAKVLPDNITAMFTIHDRAILQGIYGVPMRSEPLPLLEAAIQAIIINAYASLAQTMTPDRAVFMQLIIDSIVNNAEIQHLSVIDIQNAFTHGLTGKLDEERIVTLNVNVVNRWLIAYMGRRMEINAQLKRAQAATEREQAPTENPEKTDKDFYDYVVNFIKENKAIPPLGWRFHTYRHLAKIGQDCPRSEKEMFATICREKCEAERLRILATQGLKEAKVYEIKYQNPEQFAHYCRAAWAEKWANDLLQIELAKAPKND